MAQACPADVAEIGPVRFRRVNNAGPAPAVGSAVAGRNRVGRAQPGDETGQVCASPDSARSDAARLEVTTVGSVAELAEAERLLDVWLPEWAHGRRGRDFYRVRYPEQADLMVIARSSGARAGDRNERLVGTVLAHLDGGPDSVTVGAVAVAAPARRRGLGRAMLALAERHAAARGVSRCDLGSVDGAEPFYVACGYDVGLLVQIPPGIPEPEALVDRLLAGPLRGRDTERAEFGGWPQIRVRLPDLDARLLAVLRAAAPGVSVGYVMSKHLV